MSREIAKTKGVVWKAIRDIENSADMISSIISIEVLEKPERGFVGFKWKETREMFGREATEIMWVTDSADEEYYATRAESHGSVYISRLSVTESDGITTLTMSFSGEAKSFFGRIASTLMSPFLKGSIVKELDKDLLDIKSYVEHS